MRVLPKISLGAVLAGLLLTAGAAPAQVQNLLSGRRAPSFSLPDTKLAQHDILDYRGKWLLIEFMQVTCPHCRTLALMLEQLKPKLAGKVSVLAIVEPPDNIGAVNKYLADNTWFTSPVLFDSYLVATAYFKATPQNPSFDTPHLFAIDPNGQIVRDWGQVMADQPTTGKEIEQLVTSAAKK
jgi:peroxiredoxin